VLYIVKIQISTKLQLMDFLYIMVLGKLELETNIYLMKNIAVLLTVLERIGRGIMENIYIK